MIYHHFESLCYHLEHNLKPRSDDACFQSSRVAAYCVMLEQMHLSQLEPLILMLYCISP